MPEEKANRKYKDSVFVDFLTEDTRRLVEVYNAIKGTDFPDDTQVLLRTLKKVLYRNRNNDIAFMLGDRLIVFLEDQTTENPNMPLRFLIYCGRGYEKVIPRGAIYKTKLLKIPKPEFFVLYNGPDEGIPDKKLLRLSDAFLEADTEGNLELSAAMYNINAGHNEDILAKSRALRDFSTFVSKVRANEKNGMLLADAIEDGVNYCIQNDVMAAYLEEHASEVRNMLFERYDKDEEIKVVRAEGFEDGILEGEAKKQREVARNMKRLGADTVFIAEATGLPETEIFGL